MTVQYSSSSTVSFFVTYFIGTVPVVLLYVLYAQNPRGGRALLFEYSDKDCGFLLYVPYVCMYSMYVCMYVCMCIVSIRTVQYSTVEGAA